MSRGWDSLPPVLLVTVRHSGSHTALGILEQCFLRHAMTEKFRRDTDATKPPLWFCHSEPANMALIHKRMTEAKTLILTMRNPMAIAASWIHRGLPLDKWFMDMWNNLFALQSQYDGLWLPVDTPDRDMRLKAISERTGATLNTDWTPKGVTTHDQKWQAGMTLDEVREFYKPYHWSNLIMPKKKVTKKTAAKPRGRQAGTALRAFSFTGDKIGGDDPQSIDFMGHTFKLDGAAVKVSAETAAKLENNRHFTEK